MHDIEASTTSAAPLPKLPGMYLRSLFTVARQDDATAEATELTGQYQAPALTTAQVGRYKDAFGGFVSEVPLTLMYCLAQRVHLAQMLEDSFPWPAPGLVHVSNALEQHAPIRLNEDFVIDAHIKLPARGPKVSPRRLRPVFTVTFWQGGEKVVTCVSEYQVMPKNQPKAAKSRETKVVDAPNSEWQALATWHLAAAEGRAYAKLSGDFNPIHLHPLLSRWFGFEQPIIHGMYMAGRAHAEIERQHQQAIHKIDVTFKRPVPMPATIQLWEQCSTDDGRYQVCGAEDNLQRLEGRFTLAR